MSTVTLKPAKLPNAFFDRAQDLIDARPDLAYGSPTELFKDAIRRRLEELEAETDQRLAEAEGAQKRGSTWRDRDY